MWETVLETVLRDCVVQEASLVPGHKMFEILQAKVKVEGIGRVL